MRESVANTNRGSSSISEEFQSSRSYKVNYGDVVVSVPYAIVLVHDCFRTQHETLVQAPPAQRLQSEETDCEVQSFLNEQMMKDKVGITDENRLSTHSVASSCASSSSSRNPMPTIAYFKLDISANSKLQKKGSLSSSLTSLSSCSVFQNAMPSYETSGASRTKKQKLSSEGHAMKKQSTKQEYEVMYNCKKFTVSQPTLRIADCRVQFKRQHRTVKESLRVPDPESSRAVYDDEVLKEGTVVLAYLPVYPLWPGMIIRDQISGEHFLPSSTGGDYHVAFCFDSRVTRAWIPLARIDLFRESMRVSDSANFLKPFEDETLRKFPAKIGKKSLKTHFNKFDSLEHERAFQLARVVLGWPVQERLAAFRLKPYVYQAVSTARNAESPKRVAELKSPKAQADSAKKADASARRSPRRQLAKNLDGDMLEGDELCDSGDDNSSDRLMQLRAAKSSRKTSASCAKVSETSVLRSPLAPANEVQSSLPTASDQGAECGAFPGSFAPFTYNRSALHLTADAERAEDDYDTLAMLVDAVCRSDSTTEEQRAPDAYWADSAHRGAFGSNLDHLGGM